MCTGFNHQGKLELFSPADCLDFMAINILEPLQRTEAGNQFIVIVTDTYTKLERMIPTAKIMSTHVSNIFFNDWMIPNGIPDTVLSVNGQKFICKFFTSSWFFVGTTKPTTKALYSQTNGQLKRYSKTLVLRLRLYIADNRKSWDNFVQPLTYAYNCRVYHCAFQTLFSLVLLGNPPRLDTTDTPTALASDLYIATNPATIRQYIMIQLPSMQTKVSVALAQQPARYERCFDKKLKSLTVFCAGQMVAVNKASLTTLPANRKSYIKPNKRCRTRQDLLKYSKYETTS